MLHTMYVRFWEKCHKDGSTRLKTVLHMHVTQKYIWAPYPNFLLKKNPNRERKEKKFTKFWPGVDFFLNIKKFILKF